MWCENYRWNFDYARLAYDAGFTFENHKLQTNLDFAKIAIIDIETLIREKDVNTIERFIPFITQFALEGEQVKILDPCFVKVFRVSQLAVEYLLFCKKYLDNTVVLLKKEVSCSLEENKELRSAIQDLKSETNRLRKKLKELECASVPEIVTFRCEHCGKAFATDDYLQSHIKRRHEITNNNNNSAYQEETNRLQLEIKELKERLNTTEKLITHHEATNEKDVDTTKETNWSKLEELQQKFDILKTHVENELKLLHTQKEFHEKYEKLFEATINKTRAAFTEAEGLRGRLDNRGEGDLLLRKNSATQTYVQVQEVAVEATCDAFERGNKINKELPIEKKSDLNVDFEKMQQEFVAETQQQINKVEGAIGEMVATSLEKIESQVQTALEKLSEESLKTHEEIKESQQKSLIPIRDTSAKKSLQKPASETIKEPIPVRRKLPSTNSSLHEEEKTIQKSKIHTNTKPVPSRSVASGSKQNVAYRKSKETIQLFAKKGAMRPETESETESESESFEQEIVVQPKPSTTSTLGQYSTAKIEKAASSEEVFTQFRDEIEQLVDRRLKEIGVSPDWVGLPQRSFSQALGVVNHQAELSKKKFPDFSKMRKKLIKQLAKIIKMHNKTQTRKTSTTNKSQSKDNKHNSDTDSENDRKKQSAPISKTTYDSVISEFKNRTKPNIVLESSSSDALPEIQDKGDVAVMKSALRNELQVVEKKKVAFVDGNGDQNTKLVKGGGSTTSVASSVFDAPNKSTDPSVAKKEGNRVDSDVSDWDISEILE